MSKEEFIMDLKYGVVPYLPEEIREAGEMKIFTQMKNNDKLLHGISIEREDGQPSPVIYVDELYEKYQIGLAMEHVFEEFAEAFETAWKESPDIDRLNLSYEAVKENITCRIVNLKMNRNRLHEMKYTPVGNGYGMTYHIELGEGKSIPVTRGLAEAQGYDMRLLCREAMKNTQEQHPAVLQSMESVVFNMVSGPEEQKNLLSRNEKLQTDTMYILGTDRKTFGAAALFYPEVKEQIGELFQGDYYAIPSSVHEFILIPDEMGISAGALGQMLKEVNEKEVPAEDILGDKVLKYSREERSLKTMEPEKEKDTERGR